MSAQDSPKRPDIISQAKRTAFLATVRALRHLPMRPQTRSSGAVLVLFKVDHIGDFILSTGVLRILVDWAAQSGFVRTAIVTSTLNESIARREFPECEVIGVPFAFDVLRGGFRACVTSAWRQFGHLTGQTVVCLRHQRSFTEDLLAGWLSPQESYGLVAAPGSISEANRHAAFFQPRRAARYPTERNGNCPLELVAHAMLASMVTRRSVSVSEIKPRLESFPVSQSAGLLVFPCAHSALREYPPDSLGKVLRSLPSLGIHVVTLVGKKSDRAKLDLLAAATAGTEDLQVSIKTPDSILDAIQLIADSTVVMGMESGPAHIAIALDKPGVFLIGGGHYDLFAPWGNPARQRWLSHPLPCFSCGWRCIYPTAHCLTDIPPEHVLEEIKALLSSIDM